MLLKLAAATDEELANANLAIIKERFGLPHFVRHSELNDFGPM